MKKDFPIFFNWEDNFFFVFLAGLVIAVIPSLQDMVVGFGFYCLVSTLLHSVILQPNMSFSVHWLTACLFRQYKDVLTKNKVQLLLAYFNDSTLSYYSPHRLDNPEVLNLVMIDVVIIAMAFAGANKANLLAMLLRDCVRSSPVRVSGSIEPINADIAEKGDKQKICCFENHTRFFWLRKYK